MADKAAMIGGRRDGRLGYTVHSLLRVTTRSFNGGDQLLGNKSHSNL